MKLDQFLTTRMATTTPRNNIFTPPRPIKHHFFRSKNKKNLEKKQKTKRLKIFRRGKKISTNSFHHSKLHSKETQV